MAESTLLDLDDVHLHYIEAPGPNAILILLHGFTDSLESYVPLIPKLAALSHVYAIDFRGHGGSSHTLHNYTLGTHVDDIKRFIDMLIREPIFVAGHSMGASVAAWLAALYPDTVRGLIIEDQDFDNPPDEKICWSRMPVLSSSGTRHVQR